MVLVPALMQRQGVSFLLCRKFCVVVVLGVSTCAALSVYCSFSKYLAGCMSEGMKRSHSGLIAEQGLVFQARLPLQP